MYSGHKYVTKNHAVKSWEKQILSSSRFSTAIPVVQSVDDVNRVNLRSLELSYYNNCIYQSCCLMRAVLAQLEERQTSNLEVMSSSLIVGTFALFELAFLYKLRFSDLHKYYL